ncbi:MULTISPECIES: DUF397 domain-containing protein [unclassified Saccharopolyspora]|uniref:DUF397 domain-containing protein n=1 Tax=unclassified Saccharopolyspora TaxID=2646250 RepID=UPI001CD1D763|nr:MULTISPECIES: DUF397 domain-containing protein [unclassified Saccharopolyspora]MCA1192074.1 DUF397 domain-containing protein [Saccharopolyspora sp. 6V]MCA1280236.1 DUF397 domain-containing protein [Saccharopolyspora sp. 7B]
MQASDFGSSVAWRKSLYSSGNHNCVEVATVAAGTGIRDSKLGAAGPVLAFGHGAFDDFLAAIKDERFG